MSVYPVPAAQEAPMLVNGRSSKVHTGKFFSASAFTPKALRQAEKQIIKRRENRAWKAESV
jgi:hypothetical protein